jgi:hypothetical protein
VLGLVAVVDGVKTLMAKATFTGSTPVGTLSLNTTQLVAYFEGYGPEVKRTVFVALWDIVNNATIVVDQISIENNPFNSSMNPPTPVTPIGAAIYALIANGVDGGNSHAHTGGQGAQIDHTTLSNIGTLTHAQLETSLALKAVDATVTASLALKADQNPTSGSYRIKGGQHIQFWNPVTNLWHTLIPYGPNGSVQTSWGDGES